MAPTLIDKGDFDDERSGEGSVETRFQQMELLSLGVDTIVTYGSPLLIDPNKFPISVHYLSTGGKTPLGIILIIDNSEVYFKFVDNARPMPLKNGNFVTVGSNTGLSRVPKFDDVDNRHVHIVRDEDDGRIHVVKLVPPEETKCPRIVVNSKELPEEYILNELQPGTLLNGIRKTHVVREIVEHVEPVVSSDHPVAVDKTRANRVMIFKPFFRSLFDAANIKFEHGPQFLEAMNKVRFDFEEFNIYFNCETEMFEVPNEVPDSGEYVEVDPSMLIESVLRYCL